MIYCRTKIHIANTSGKAPPAAAILPSMLPRRSPALVTLLPATACCTCRHCQPSSSTPRPSWLATRKDTACPPPWPTPPLGQAFPPHIQPCSHPPDRTRGRCCPPPPPAIPANRGCHLGLQCRRPCSPRCHHLHRPHRHLAAHTDASCPLSSQTGPTAFANMAGRPRGNHTHRPTAAGHAATGRHAAGHASIVAADLAWLAAHRSRCQPCPAVLTTARQARHPRAHWRRHLAPPRRVPPNLRAGQHRRCCPRRRLPSWKWLGIPSGFWAPPWSSSTVESTRKPWETPLALHVHAQVTDGGGRPVKADLAHVQTLTAQHRMRPDLPGLVHELAYPDFMDADGTKGHGGLRGMQENIVFVEYDHAEPRMRARRRWRQRRRHRGRTATRL
jgi:hypothetical protein